MKFLIGVTSGLDFAAHGYIWTRELCLLDSDLDGISNGQELGTEQALRTT